VVDGAYEDGPCMWQVLAHVSDEAFVHVSKEEAIAEGQAQVCPHATVYVEREEEIAGTLRCIGAGAVGMDVVTRSEALSEGLPGIAGWYAIRWWD
jgi:hypothetical protein